jgi:hypothetical protein
VPIDISVRRGMVNLAFRDVLRVRRDHGFALDNASMTA